MRFARAPREPNRIESYRGKIVEPLRRAGRGLKMRAIWMVLATLSLAGCSGTVGPSEASRGAVQVARQAATVNAQTCYDTARSSLDFTPGGGRVKLIWHNSEEKHFKLKQFLTYGQNDNAGTAQFDIQNDTCNTFDAPEPSSGTVVLYVQFSGCLQSCPQTIDFSSHDKAEFRIIDNQLVPSVSYSVYLFANGSSTPSQIIAAKGISGGIEFPTPFQSPLQLQPADDFYLEVVQD